MAESAEIDLLPKQTEAWDLWEDEHTTEVGYGGAAGGGKTRLGWYLAITIAEMYPGSRGCVARKELKTLRLTSLAELFIIFQELGYKKERDYKYKEQDGIIKFPNGSEILLLDTARDTQDPEYTKFGSLNLTWGWIEESNETPEKARNILNTRVGRHNSFKVKGKVVIAKAFWLETFNPNKGHVYRNYYRPWKDKKLPKHRAFVRALPNDNPHLPEAYIEKLRNSPDKTIRERLLKGNFDYDSDPNRLMIYDAIIDLKTNTLEDRGHDDVGRPIKPEKFLINDIARFGGDKIVKGLFEDMVLVGLWVHQYVDTDTSSKDIKDLEEEHKVPRSHILSDENGVGGGCVDQLKGSKGFNGGSKPLEMMDHFKGKKISQNYANLRSQCFFSLAEVVNLHTIAIRIRYFETNIEGYTLQQAISEIEEELDAIKQKEDSGEDRKKLIVIPKAEIKEAIGRSPDFADMMSMRMWYVLKPTQAVAAPAPVRRSSGPPTVRKNPAL